MLAAQAVERALRYIRTAPTEAEQTTLRTSLALNIKSTLTQMAREIAAAPEWAERQIMRRAFDAITASGGIADLTAAITDDEPLLLEPNLRWDVYCDNIAGKLQMQRDRGLFDLDRPPGYGYGAVDGTNLYIDDGSGSAYGGDVVVTGNYVQSLDNLKPEIEERFVKMLAASAGGGQQSVQT